MTRRVIERELSFVLGDLLLSSDVTMMSLAMLSRSLYKRVRRYAREFNDVAFRFLGDGFIVAFRTTNEAVGFAAMCASDLRRDPLVAGGAPVAVRMVVHRGRVGLAESELGDDIVGGPVAEAARISQQVTEGEVVVTEDALRSLSGYDMSRFEKHRGLKLNGGARKELASLKAEG